MRRSKADFGENRLLKFISAGVLWVWNSSQGVCYHTPLETRPRFGDKLLGIRAVVGLDLHYPYLLTLNLKLDRLGNYLGNFSE